MQKEKLKISNCSVLKKTGIASWEMFDVETNLTIYRIDRLVRHRVCSIYEKVDKEYRFLTAVDCLDVAKDWCRKHYELQR